MNSAPCAKLPAEAVDIRGVRDSYLAFIADKRRAAEDRGIGWAVWSWRGTMRVSVSDDSYTLDPQVCTALGLPGC